MSLEIILQQKIDKFIELIGKFIFSFCGIARKFLKKILMKEFLIEMFRVSTERIREGVSGKNKVESLKMIANDMILLRDFNKGLSSSIFEDKAWCP